MIENSWFYYFSSLAQTVAAGSALLIALAVINLQNLDNSLNSIERSIAEAFYNISEMESYQRLVLVHFLDKEWAVYFREVGKLADKYSHKFAGSDHYLKSKEFLDSLIRQGHSFETRYRTLHSTLIYTFIGTVIFAGGSVLTIPIAQWITPQALWYSWIFSGIMLAILFMIYLRLVLRTLKIQRSTEVK